jgi:hypothetical protein
LLVKASGLVPWTTAEAFFFQCIMCRPRLLGRVSLPDNHPKLYPTLRTDRNAEPETHQTVGARSWTLTSCSEPAPSIVVYAAVFRACHFLYMLQHLRFLRYRSFMREELNFDSPEGGGGCQTIDKPTHIPQPGRCPSSVGKYPLGGTVPPHHP